MMRSGKGTDIASISINSDDLRFWSRLAIFARLLRTNRIDDRTMIQSATHRFRTTFAVVAFALIAVTVVAASPSSAQQTLRIAAVVNDRVLSMQDLQSRTTMIVKGSNLPNNIETHRKLWPQVLRTLVDEQLQLEEAEAKGIKIPEQDLARAKSILEKRNKWPAGTFEKALTNIGVDPVSALTQLRAEIAWTKLVRRRFSSSFKVTDEEVDEVLENLRRNQDKPQSRVSEILLPVDDPARESEILELARRLTAQIRAGSDFAAVAREFSRDAAAATGGDIGWVIPEQLSPELGTAIKSLKPGELSEPVRTIFGFHVLRLADRRLLSRPNPLDATVTLKQVFLPVPPKASSTEVDSQKSIAQAIKESARNCADMDELAKEVRSPAGADLGKMKLRDLAPILRAPVAALAVGKPSAPVRLPGGFSVLMVCDKVEPTSPLPSADMIRARLVNKKFGSLAQRYIRDLRRAAFIETRI